MRLNFNLSNMSKNYDIRNDDQFHNYRRIININSIKTTTMKNNPIYNIFHTLIDVPPTFDTEFTSITVRNQSVVKGSIHTKNGSIIKQNDYVHHGIIYDRIENINADSIVEFSDLNYSVFVDENVITKPGANLKSCELFRSSNMNYFNSELTPVKVDGRESIIPDPLHYDEIDQIKGTDVELNYVDTVTDLNVNGIRNTFKTTLGKLIDQNTVVFKKTIFVENLEIFDEEISNHSSFVGIFGQTSYVTDITAEICDAMERTQFASGTFIFNGEGDTFNVTELTRQFVEDDSQYISNYKSLMEEMSGLNNILPNTTTIYVTIIDSSSIYVKFRYKNPIANIIKNISTVHRTEVNNLIGIR